MSLVEDYCNLEYLLFHDFLLMNTFLADFVIQFMEIALKLFNMLFDLMLYLQVNTTIFSPVLSLLI
jgi:hypothetical protein